MQIRDGWLVNVPRVISPNCDDRPLAHDISLIVVHGISLPPGQYGGPYIDALFTNTLDPQAHAYFAEIADLHVSAHVLIRRDGAITQYVPFHRRAWHAGQSCFAGRDCCNDFSIGIELEGCDNEPYAEAQYDSLTSVVLALLEAYPKLNDQSIVGHCDIAPGRKTDPGPAFDWDYWRRQLAVASPSSRHNAN